MTLQNRDNGASNLSDVFIEALVQLGVRDAFGIVGGAIAPFAEALERRGKPGYRTSMGWGSMGHAVTGVVGASLALNQKAVAVVGDGAMLMNGGEVSTAVEYKIPAVWIVLNDGQYGMVKQGMAAWGLKPCRLGIPSTDFAALARAMGAEGSRITSELFLEQELLRAMDAPGPFVIDVVIDPEEVPPVRGRTESLARQAR